MKRIIYSLGVLLLLSNFTLSAQNKSERTESSVSTEIREVPAFNAIDISGRFAVVIYNSDTPEVSVTASSRYIADVVTSVDNGTLRVNMANLIGDENVSIVDGVKTKYNDYLLRKPIEIKIGVKGLNILNLSGLSNLVAKETMEAEKFYISLGDAAKVFMNLDISDSLDVHLAGAAKLDLEGKTNYLKLNVHGASSVSASKLTAAHSEVQLTGAARADIHTTESLDADLKGASKLNCTGSPKSVKQKSTMGSGITIK